MNELSPNEVYPAVTLHDAESLPSGCASEQNRTYKSTGSVYTPQTLATYVAHKLFDYALNRKNTTSKSKTITVLDPACGDGQLLIASKNTATPNMTMQLIGLDINKSAIRKAKKRIPDESTFLATNGLCPFNKTNGQGWLQLKKRLKLNDGVDWVIANPPWGANTSEYRHLINDSGFVLNEGQVDSSDLFIEASLKIVKENGFIAFIIPDSLFYQERSRLRQHLLENTKILFVGRFGEKIFKDINRACAVIICQKTKRIDNHLVDCFRLTPEYRKDILSGKNTFLNAEMQLFHKVKQDRFKKNREFIFNIDLNDSLETSFNKLSMQKSRFRDFLISSRGVELSKKGEVVQCQSCSHWLPLPKKNTLDCPFCQNTIVVSHSEAKRIIHTEKMEGRRRLLAGADIQRYFCKSSLWIDLGVKGINYKVDSLYTGPKLVVRKTGVGLSSTIDYSESLTNQVVYIFKQKENSQRLPIEFFQAVAGSRAIFFYLSMMNGENEWKSHPYVTQSQILDLPFPDVSYLEEPLIEEIRILCGLLRRNLREHENISTSLDAKIERIVAEAFNLSKEDYVSIYKAIDGAQDLVPIRALKNIAIEDIF